MIFSQIFLFLRTAFYYMCFIIDMIIPCALRLLYSLPETSMNHHDILSLKILLSLILLNLKNYFTFDIIEIISDTNFKLQALSVRKHPCKDKDNERNGTYRPHYYSKYCSSQPVLVFVFHNIFYPKNTKQQCKRSKDE